MRSAQFEHFVEARVTVLTEGERIEGVLFYAGATRLSDFLNAPIQQESKFLKVKDPKIFCRRSGAEICQVPFLMVARDRVVVMMTHATSDLNDPDMPESSANLLARASSSQYMR